MQKKAEKKLTDAGKFPIESCRERIARRFGEEAVALSGPCEGSSLVDCVCQQLQSRWDKIGDKLASEAKAVKVAMRLAQSYSSKDDTQACVDDLEKLGYEKKAAAGIADYLKAFAMEKVAFDELDEIVDDVAEEPEVEDDLGFDEFEDEEPIEDEVLDEPTEEEFVEEVPEEEQVEVGLEGPGELPPEEPLGGELPPEVGGDTVTIELPQDVADELMAAISGAAGGAPPVEEGVIEITDEVPGEPAEIQEPGEQVVTGEPAPAVDEACSLADGGPRIDEDEPHFPGETHEEHEAHEKAETPEEEKEEHESGKPEGEEPKEHVEEMKERAEKMEEGKSREEAKEEVDKGKGDGEQYRHRGEDEEEDEKEKKEAAMMLRGGRLRRVGQTILRLGPEMHLNNTDQQAGGKPLGTAKDKSVEDPKPVADGNLETEGYSAGDKKFQDGSTLGKEQKFDAKTVSKDEVSGGEASLMGKDESLPSGGPDVPAGSSPIGNEPWQGGDVATKGTVIATFTPKGLVVETPEGRKFLAKASIKSVTPELVESVGNIPYDGDGKKFAAAALKLIRESKCVRDEGVTKTDTSKLEATNFTNDGKKEPEEGGAVAGKKGSPANPDEGVTKTDTSKLEATKFTNDEEKKAEAANDIETLIKQAKYLKEVDRNDELLGIFVNNLKLAWKGIPEDAPVGPLPDEAPGRRDLMSEIDSISGQIGEVLKKQGPRAAAGLRELRKILSELQTTEEESGWRQEAGSKATVKVAEDKQVKDPRPVAENLDTEGYSAGDKKFQDGKTIGKEQKFDAKEVSKDEVSKGNASLMGNEKRDLGGVPDEKPRVPAGGGKMGNEPWDGGNVETKGTVIASEEAIQKREAEARKQAENEAKVREARLASAAALAADMLRHGEIDEKEYKDKVDELSKMPVQAIQQLALTVRQTRQKMASRVAAQAEPVKTAGLSVPIIPQNANEGKTLVERLIPEFKLSKQLNALDDMK